MHGACQHRWNGFVLRHNLLGGPNGPGYEDEWVRFTARGRSPLRIRLEKYLHCASGDVLGTGCKTVAAAQLVEWFYTSGCGR